jgi:hypothetical protein
MRRMLARLALAAAIFAIGGSEVLAHGARSNFSMTSPKFVTASPKFVTPGPSISPAPTAFSRGGGDRIIVVVRQRPVFFRPAFDRCGRRLFVTTPRLHASPCFACRIGFTDRPWAMRTRSFARR